MYDPATFGTPLAMLQIPPAAITMVQAKAQDPNLTLTHYSQDCQTLQNLKSELSTADAICARGTTVDVGYICKQCHMVYPGQEACVSHQAAMCLRGKSSADTKMAILKLEQLQFECTLCRQTYPTTAEYKQHCSSEQHKQKSAKNLAQRTSSNDTATTNITNIAVPSNIPSNGTEDGAGKENTKPPSVEIPPIVVKPIEDVAN